MRGRKIIKEILKCKECYFSEDGLILILCEKHKKIIAKIRIEV